MYDANNIKVDPRLVRVTSGAHIAPIDVASRIENMRSTVRGTLRTMHGPVEYHPTEWEDTGGTVPANTSYDGPFHGVFHCTLHGGARDILLAHFGGYIWEHHGWDREWVKLVGDHADAAYRMILPEDDDVNQYGTQFVATPNGVIIVPQGARALFYDGTTVAPLGYDRAPGAPTTHAPRNKTTAGAASDADELVGTQGYSHNGRNMGEVMGLCRLGSIRNDVFNIDDNTKKSNALGGVLEGGSWRSRLQWLDEWGNLSPLSPWSAPATVAKQDNLTKNRNKDEDELAARMRLQVAWGDLNDGPDYTRGKILLRTKDEQNSGIPGVFVVPSILGVSTTDFATIPDNTTKYYFDNTPDTWLVERAKSPAAVPIFRLACMAFGRTWIGNWPGGEGTIRPSMPGRWGTFLENEEIPVDTSGGEITGMWATAFGILVFTDRSTYLVTPNDNGDGWRSANISNRVGCVAPRSVQTLPSGLTVWVGHDGFYAYPGGEEVVSVSRQNNADIADRMTRASRVRACSAVDPDTGFYLCWLPLDGHAAPSHMVAFDGTGFRGPSDHVQVHAVCSTRDEREMLLALGYTSVYDHTAGSDIDHHPSLYALYRDGVNRYQSNPPTGIVETHWLKAHRSHRHSHGTVLELWLVETEDSDLTIEVFRDWRETVNLVTDPTKQPVTRYTERDKPPFWDDAELDGTYIDKETEQTLDIPWVRRRPYWVRYDITVPDAETYKMRISGEGDWEFIGFRFEEADSHGGMAKHARGE